MEDESEQVRIKTMSFWQPRLTPRDGFESVNISLDLPAEKVDQEFNSSLHKAILRTRSWFLGEQHTEGYWEAELEGDTILESEYILLLAFLGREQSDSARKAARYLLKKQMPGGGWGMYPGSKLEISGSVKAYFALKLTGEDPSSEPMQRARNAILAAGGADRVNSFTRFYLALLGQIGYEHCPEVPPEVVLLPKWLPVNLFRVSAWSRTIIVPLSIMSAYRPVREIEPARSIRDLFLEEPENWPPLRCPGQTGGDRLFSWDRFFRVVDRTLKFFRHEGILPLRKRALTAARRWMLERFEGSDGLGAIFPPIVWSIIALRCLGYEDESPEVIECHRQLEELMIEEHGAVRLQPCKSPVWDTAITMRALSDSGLSHDHSQLQSAAGWLLEKEVRRRGDWSSTVRAEPGGWCFEHNNEFYPDLDDTAMVLMSLRTVLGEDIDCSGALPNEGYPPRATPDSLPDHAEENAHWNLPPYLSVIGPNKLADLDTARQRIVRQTDILAAAQRAITWTIAMQNSDGGWGAFDRNNDHEFLCHVPFADHNAMIDPSTPDLTARVLEGLASWGFRLGNPAVDRAVRYLRETQEADGSWFGRWGVNYIYGTWQTIVGLVAVGVPTDDPVIVAAANWLLSYQQPVGGWGESPDSYEKPSMRGQGRVTASQTAWALLGLIAAGKADHPAVHRGVNYLLHTQTEDGCWNEREFTGTGFPQVFYLRYHMYPIYFPLMALGQYAASGQSGGEVDKPVSLRLFTPNSFVS